MKGNGKRKADTKSYKKRVYMLRCHNGMFAAHPDLGKEGDSNPFRLVFRTFRLERIFLLSWYFTTDRNAAVRYRDENNAYITEANKGFTLEVVKVDCLFNVTPGTIEFDRPKPCKVVGAKGKKKGAAKK